MSEYKRFSSAFRGYDKKEVERYLKDMEARHHKVKAEKMEELERLSARREALAAQIEELEAVLDSQDMDPGFIQLTGEALDSRMDLLAAAAKKDKEAVEEAFLCDAREIQRQQADINEQIQVCRRKFKFLLGNIRRMAKEAEAGKGLRRPELKVLENKNFREPAPEEDFALSGEETAEKVRKPLAVGMGNIEIKEPGEPAAPGEQGKQESLPEKEPESTDETKKAGTEREEPESGGELLPPRDEEAGRAETSEETSEEETADFTDLMEISPKEERNTGVFRQEPECNESSAAALPVEKNQEAVLPAEENQAEAFSVEENQEAAASRAASGQAPKPPEEPAKKDPSGPEGASPWALRYRFLWGKKSGGNLFDSKGVPIIAKGETITSQTVDRAVAAGALDRLVRDMTE
ncbi:MAG: hypothetical protein VB085_02705 [Peptococcaceae bacterium]|nr:hypothetical protein [Peptococcaceae bacterium]